VLSAGLAHSRSMNNRAPRDRHGGLVPPRDDSFCDTRAPAQAVIATSGVTKHPTAPLPVANENPRVH
jgi:hypothetical protein